tara:strand:+ start:4950 stop:5303 length:354 start_codon:yes stop_codon:yes gene_type:complete
MLKNTFKVFLTLLFIILTSFGYSNENKLNDYYKSIRCLVCEGQSISESDTEFSINLKEQIKKKYISGLSFKEIQEELISIYGEEISFKPPNDHYLLWLSPLILLIIFIILIRKKFKF